ncbi:hypothetical protein TD95_005398 [Thielaviopsis punctulata]|uniref:Dynactin subunit 4 n=1 Tax=Thielaviopsis punctulata TaxID=72032 RepID=A0A0F4ZBJ6_9PEZI|nr:hypothetical protein TD95_005398 [Thielaviopsis punctulata]
MVPQGPYTYFQCPCSDPSTLLHPNELAVGGAGSRHNPEDYDDERAFDPRAPRSNYSLFPLEYLMYCEDCQEIRCPRCVNEEIATYYCPNCIFEVPSSNIKSEGNRCTRSCFQCPVCVGTLVVTSLERNPERTTADPAAAASTGGPYVMNCTYCQWSSSEIGIEFEKSNGVYSQLARIKNGGKPKLTARELKDRRKENPTDAPLTDAEIDPDIHFSNLKAFYQNQVSDINTPGTPSLIGDLGFSAPGSLSRIMSIYTGGSLGGKRSQAKNTVMGEANTAAEGLKLASLDESAALAKLHSARWEDTVSQPQNENQTYECRFADELRPVPVLLRTKRSKRCPACRHIIAKPEAKVHNTRYRIRLVAANYVPSITIKPMHPGPPPPLRNLPVAPTLPDLRPNVPAQFILTFKNPIFEPIKITLATSSSTPGRFPSKVTLLCPQFTVDANTDMWDDALKNDEKRRTRGHDENMQAEAGKVWDRGRNWVSIVLEVIPSALDLKSLKWAKSQGEDVDDSPVREDEEIIEIPLFVRMEWETENQEETAGKEKAAKEKRELAYWSVLGVGRIGAE